MAEISDGLSPEIVGTQASKHGKLNERSSRIPGLDGLRAISICFVFLAHLTGTANFPRALQPLSNLGELGVHSFFVISGFLITSLLLKEQGKTGSISLISFYQRRLLRILPALYAYIGSVCLLAAIGIVTLLPNDLLYANTYSINYHWPRSWYLGHLWSLSVEEQFYFLWPAVLCFAGPKRAFKIALGVVAIAPLSRISMWYLAPSMRMNMDCHFQSVADALAIGCLLAGMRPTLANWQLYQRFLRSPAFLLVPITLLATQAAAGHPRIYYSLGASVEILCVALCIDRCVTICMGAMGRMLNSRILGYIGVLSYSLYLWQQPFLNRGSTSIYASFPINIILAFVAALASYYLVEKPFLRIKDRNRVTAKSRNHQKALDRAVVTTEPEDLRPLAPNEEIRIPIPEPA
jgi:peptidoglycan/LPS O-acetylase OafA/YrhL